MKILKLILLLLALGVSAYVLFWLFGIFISLFWYAFWVGLVLVGGTVTYKLFLSGADDEKPQLQEPRPTAISELENTDRALEEYKEKYLPNDNNN